MFIPGVCWVIAWCCNYGTCGERTGTRRGVNPQKKGFSALPHELGLLPGSLQPTSTVDMYTDVDFISTKGKWKHNHTQSYSQTYLAPLWVHSPHSLSPCEGAGKSAKNKQPQFSFLSFFFFNHAKGRGWRMKPQHLKGLHSVQWSFDCESCYRALS